MVFKSIRKNSGRSPRGERGLKLYDEASINGFDRSLPSRGAWIEIALAVRAATPIKTSLPSRGAWIEIQSVNNSTLTGYGRSPRGERGLKSFFVVILSVCIIVAPLAGSVD